MGKNWEIKWSEEGERERVWVVNRGNKIEKGMEENLVIEKEEMYGEKL